MPKDAAEACRSRSRVGSELETALGSYCPVEPAPGATAINDHSAFWTKPISIDLDTGERLVLRSPQDALYALVSDWPVNGGVHQQRAIDFCRAWLAGRMPAETVRQAFILAALEAGVPIADDENGTASSVENPAM
ncbi:DUF982 domain-containing protein [Rhizobium etli]|uniref:DUF982 domain-containing protein n=1 Tax=Rhizobium etli TaxID=29449 RepID=A0A7W6ZD62_RHIET|nr:DUF982 domain-containing protein [Rhizobium etli]MBB4477889.1 hypothetical protein [Rhizobium etli]MBB4533721.1 hypothetical protein [Rhizobium etli]